MSYVNWVFACIEMPKIEKSFYEGKAFLKPKTKTNPTGVKNGEIVTIQSLEKTTLTGKDGKTKETYIETFKEHEEGLTLNKGNVKSQVDLFGDETDKWIGEKVKLIVILAHNPNTGTEVKAIRVKAKDWEFTDDEEES